MAWIYESERVVGVANTETFGTGITSTEAEPKTLAAVFITVSAREQNRIRLWLEREKILDVIDGVLPLEGDYFRYEIPVDLEIPIGRTVKPAVLCGGTATDLNIAFKYEVR